MDGNQLNLVASAKWFAGPDSVPSRRPIMDTDFPAFPTTKSSPRISEGKWRDQIQTGFLEITNDGLHIALTHGKGRWASMITRCTEPHTWAAS